MKVTDEQIAAILTEVEDDDRSEGVGRLLIQRRTLLQAIGERDATIKLIFDGPPAHMGSPLGLLPINSTGMRTLVDALGERDATIAELRAKFATVDREALDLLWASNQSMRDELAELRKPVADTQCDSVLSEIVRTLRIACPAWADVDVDTRNELIGKWRKMMERRPVAVERNATVESIRIGWADGVNELEKQPDLYIGRDYRDIRLMLQEYDTLARDNARWQNARDVLAAEMDSLKKRVRLFDECNEYWQARFNVLSDAWRDGDNAKVLDACMRFVKANDAAPARVKLEEMRGLRERADNLQMQAQCHAQEARTANSTINEIYQACTGATGEPGTWNGAQPVIDAISRYQEQVAGWTETYARANAGLAEREQIIAAQRAELQYLREQNQRLIEADVLWTQQSNAAQSELASRAEIIERQRRELQGFHALLVEAVAVYDEYCNEWPDAISWREKVASALALPQQLPNEPDHIEEEETPCPIRKDGLHCNCWYDGDPCCGCQHEGYPNGQAWPTCAEIRGTKESVNG